MPAITCALVIAALLAAAGPGHARAQSPSPAARATKKDAGVLKALEILKGPGR